MHDESTYKFPAKERLAIQRSHRLCRGIDIAENDVCLTAHGHRLERNDIEDWAVHRKEHINRCPQVGLLYLGRGQVCDIEAIDKSISEVC